MLAPGHEHNPSRLQNGAHAHGDRAARRVLLAAEIAGGVAPGEAVERHQARARAPRASRFVESDVTRAADPEELEVDAAGRANHLLVVAAMRVDRGAGEGAVRHVGVRRGNVDVVQQMDPHVMVVTLRMAGRQALVLVEIEGDDVRETQPLLAVHPHQLGIKTHRRRTGGKSEDRGAAFPLARSDQFGGRPGDRLRGFETAREYADRHAFKAGGGEGGFDERRHWAGQLTGFKAI